MRTGMNADWSWERSAREYVGFIRKSKRQARRRRDPRRSGRTAPTRSATEDRLKFGARCSEHITSRRPSSFEARTNDGNRFPALFWHHHQPYYPDDVAGENPMPWVRLHATKDYLGMALHLEEVPEFSCTINLVPSLLAQLQAYVERGHRHASEPRRGGRPTA